MKSKALFFLAILMILFSCNKDEEKRDSIFGSWNCEHYSDLSQNKKYQVSIAHSAQYDSLIVISNFHNLGLEQESQVFVKQNSDGDLVIEDVLINGSIFISGKGVVADDFSEIIWKYTFTNNVTENVEARYY